jgi:opacity protein-like surface antigen
MKTKLMAGIALAAITVAASLSGTASAADLGGAPMAGGSMKDGYVQPMPEVSRGAGPCYIRADVGYSWARDPDIKWPTGREDVFLDAGGNELYRTFTHVTDEVTNTSRENGAFGEVGAGCTLWGNASSGRALRGEVMFGFRGDRKVDGEPGDFDVVTHQPLTPDVTVPVVDDPLHTSIKSHTLMVNLYKDLGKYGRVTPYVGAGVGVAMHTVDETYFTENYNLLNRIEGNENFSFAWSLMAGVGYQLTDRATLDLGYRYIDMGDAESGRVDNHGFVNPKVDIDDLAAHEIKVGLRFSLGEMSAAPDYAPMK